MHKSQDMLDSLIIQAFWMNSVIETMLLLLVYPYSVIAHVYAGSIIGLQNKISNISLDFPATNLYFLFQILHALFNIYEVASLVHKLGVIHNDYQVHY